MLEAEAGGGEDAGDSQGVGGGTSATGYNSTYDATQTSAGSGGSFGQGGSTNKGDGRRPVAEAGMEEELHLQLLQVVIHKVEAGGSGYIYTSSTASNYPSGCKLNSSYYLTNAQTIAGGSSFSSPSGGTEVGHSGNGYARITKVQ